MKSGPKTKNTPSSVTIGDDDSGSAIIPTMRIAAVIKKAGDFTPSFIELFMANSLLCQPFWWDIHLDWGHSGWLVGVVTTWHPMDMAQ